MKNIILSFCFEIYHLTFSQTFTISGTVKESLWEPIIGAKVFDTKSKRYTLNEYGFFSLTLPKDSVFKVSYMGLQRGIP